MKNRVCTDCWPGLAERGYKSGHLLGLSRGEYSHFLCSHPETMALPPQVMPIPCKYFFGWRFVHLLLPRIKRQLCAPTNPAEHLGTCHVLWQWASSWELALKNANIPLFQNSGNAAGISQLERQESHGVGPIPAAGMWQEVVCTDFGMWQEVVWHGIWEGAELAGSLAVTAPRPSLSFPSPQESELTFPFAKLRESVG